MQAGAAQFDCGKHHVNATISRHSQVSPAVMDQIVQFRQHAHQRVAELFDTRCVPQINTDELDAICESGVVLLRNRAAMNE